MPTLGRRVTKKTQEIVQKLKDYESPAALSFSLSHQSLPQEKGEGMYVKDIDGNTYLDFMSGFGVVSTGHCHPQVVAAACEQASRMVHAMATTSGVRAQLLECIARLTPGPADDKAIQLGVGGGDAVEIALKQGRFYAQKPGIIAFEGAYHGRTTGSLAVTAYNVFRRGIGPLFYGVTHLPYAYCYRCAFGLSYPACDLQCARYVERKISAPFSGIEVGTVIVEPVQGVGGMVAPPTEFLAELRRICNRYGVVMIVDEVMSGWARTGKMFACQHSDIIPDILTCAKGIASGYPISAVVSRKALLDGWQPSTEGFTFSGSLVSCAAGLATLRIIEEQDLAGNARNVGCYFAEQLRGLQEQFSFIGEVRQRGLMVAMEMVKDRWTKEPLPAAGIIESLMDKGLLAYLGGYYRNAVAFLPPLICSKSDVDEAVRILASVLTAVAGD